jgi:hypothetical protein
MQTATALESYVRLHWLAWTTERRLACRVVNPVLSIALSALGEPRFRCPVCEYRGTFFSYASMMTRRNYAMCPNCGSFERHRLQWLVLNALPERSRFSKMRVLHFAPEPFLAKFFRRNFREYTTADLTLLPLNVD